MNERSKKCNAEICRRLVRGQYQNLFRTLLRSVLSNFYVNDLIFIRVHTFKQQLRFIVKKNLASKQCIQGCWFNCAKFVLLISILLLPLSKPDDFTVINIKVYLSIEFHLATYALNTPFIPYGCEMVPIIDKIYYDYYVFYANEMIIILFGCW